jgi:hypothetical protein
MTSVENDYKRGVETGTWKPALIGKDNEEIAALKSMIEANNAEITALKASQGGNSGGQDNASKRAAGKRYLLQMDHLNPKCLKIVNIIGVQIIEHGLCILKPIVKG